MSAESISDPSLIGMTAAIFLVPFLTSVILIAIRYFEDVRGKKIEKPPLYSAILGIGSLLISLALSIVVALQYFTKYATGAEEITVVEGKWDMIMGTNFHWGIMLDPLGVLMTLVLAVIASAIHIYSYEYMKHGEPEVTRFFSFMNFFTGSMFGFILAGNLFTSFIFWEMLGVSSYFLIGYYWYKPVAAAAAKKAFLYNKVGDVSFMVAIIFTYMNPSNLEKSVDYTYLATLHIPVQQLVLPGLLLFGAAVGKSAQFPLLGWLPEAMEGPTPVSALLHSSTMVKAGLFLLIRNFAIYYDVTDFHAHLPHVDVAAATVVAWIGITTALLGGLMAMTSIDIKRILAFSTISQLGYIATAIGSGAKSAAFYHIISHATFKSLLFLTAGAVILNTHHTQDIRKMGGLGRHMKLTFFAMATGLFGLSGFPFLSPGFYSKDAIIYASEISAIPGHTVIYWIGVFTAFLTAFYSTRMLVLVFLGKPRYNKEEIHPHEAGWFVLGPLLTLSSLVIIEGLYWMLNSLFGVAKIGFLSEEWLGEFLGVHGAEFTVGSTLMSVVFVLLGYFVGWLLYLGKPELLPKIRSWNLTLTIEKVINNRFGLDMFLYWLAEGPGMAIGDFFKNYGDAPIDKYIIDGLFRDGSLEVASASDYTDRNIVDGAVNETWKFFRNSAKLLRPLQNGLTGFYAKIMIGAFTLVLVSLNVLTMMGIITL